MTKPMASMVKEIEYFSSRYPTREALEAAREINWDATTAGQLARCPRNGQYAIRYGLRPKEEAIYLNAGNALHAALNYYYSGADGDLCLEELRRIWGKGYDYRSNGKYGHLHLGFLEVVFKNYMDYARKRDTFKPLIVKMEDLDLTRVLGAVWRVAEDGSVILGESKVIMEFTVNGEDFVYSGKPDLPIEMGGAVYLMDHKSTNGYLSGWYFDQYRFSNQLRGYCAIVSSITHLRLNGALINGLYIGERAILTEFKGDRFGRYGPMLFDPSQLSEAIKNQYYWRKALDYFEQTGYYPQHTGRDCVSCPFATLCALPPSIRDLTIRTDYDAVDRSFLDL